MVHLGSLWLPIIVSAVLVFVTSSIVHMVLRYHHRDYTKLPNEDAVRAAIQVQQIEEERCERHLVASPVDL